MEAMYPVNKTVTSLVASCEWPLRDCSPKKCEVRKYQLCSGASVMICDRQHVIMIMDKAFADKVSSEG